MDEKIRDPEAMVDELRAKKVPASDTTATQIEVCLEAVDGWFVVSFSGPIRPSDSYDWIGLYESTSARDDDYVRGNNWNWATKGRSYTTSTKVVTSGYETRYLIWDGKKYRAIRKSGAFKAACSK